MLHRLKAPKIMETPNYLLKWRRCTLYWNYHTLFIVLVKIVSWQIWVYNSYFLLHFIVVIVVVFRMMSRTVGLRRRRALLHVVIIICRCPALSSYIVCTHFNCHVLRSLSCILARRLHCILPLCIVVKWQSKPFFLSECIDEFGIRS